MEIDSPLPHFPSLSPRKSIVKRLVELGVPKEEITDHFKYGIVNFAKENRSRIPDLVAAILPTDREISCTLLRANAGFKKYSGHTSLKTHFRESMVWLQWLMFEGEPGVALKLLAEMSVGERGVCGAVWGEGDLAYRCRTCENDPTCAICVPCFQNGNHKDHEYSIMYTGGGCCDCGDVTAWNQNGFCSNHKGVEKIQPLQENYVNSVGAVVDALLHYWKSKLLLVESSCQNKHADKFSELKEAAKDMTFVIVEMILEFCKQSESLLTFIAGKMYSVVGLLDILVRGERFLNKNVTSKLHELLLKMLADPVYKYEFGKVFLTYYPTVIDEAIKASTDNIYEKYPLLSTFSVQIFTVPLLTLRLVKEVNLLHMLLGCLEDILYSCAGEDGHLQVSKLPKVYETTVRVIEDIRYVMSHVEVPKYIIYNQLDILKTWTRLLTFMQGMDPLKRKTGILMDDENDIIHNTFILGNLIANIHSKLTDVLCSVSNAEEANDDSLSNTKQESDDIDSHRHAKVGRISKEKSACSAPGRSMASPWVSKVTESGTVNHLTVPCSVTSLLSECLRAMENWLRVDSIPGTLLNISSHKSSSVSDYLALKKKIMKVGKGKHIFSKLKKSNEAREMRHQPPLRIRLHTSLHLESGQLSGQGSNSMRYTEVGSNNSEALDDGMMEGELATELESISVLSSPDWPDIVFDGSSQDISVHIPLHQLLALIIQKLLRRCYDEPEISNLRGSSSPKAKPAVQCDFFEHLLRGCHPYGFSAFVMEHPLRIIVFCAEVRAGMWRKNGDAALFSSHMYKFDRPHQTLELHHFLLQCCAALAPPDLYVQRILERFGLSNYISLNLQRSSEYEPVLLQEMLTLLIQIVKERRFCGLTTAECLKRELIYKLATGDATHSQIVKSLPKGLSKTELPEILNNIANYSHPSGTKQGMYSLRWQFWKELDLYHLRWNPGELQVAEERYLHFCGASALTAQLPRWTKIYEPMNGVARVATCKTLLLIIRAVLFYAVFCDQSTASRAPDGVLLTSLHLLSLALDICSQQVMFDEKSGCVGGFFPMLALAGEDMGGEVTAMWGEQTLLSLLVLLMRMHKREHPGSPMELENCDISSCIGKLLKKFAEIDPECRIILRRLAPEVVTNFNTSVTSDSIQGAAFDSDNRKAKSRERQAAIMTISRGLIASAMQAKMKAEQSKFMESIDSSAEDNSNDYQPEKDVCTFDVEAEQEDGTQDICALCHDHNSKNPLSFLVLLQKSRLTSLVNRGPPSWDRAPILGKKQLPVPISKAVDHFGRTQRLPSSSTSESPSPELLQFVENPGIKFARDGQSSEVGAFHKFTRVRFPTVWSSKQPCIPNDVDSSTASPGKAPHASNDVAKDTIYSFKTLEEDIFSTIWVETVNNTHNSQLIKDDNKEHNSIREGTGNQDPDASMHGGYHLLSKSENHLREQTPSECTGDPLPYDGYGPSNCDGVHISSCGHAVHQGCLDRYTTSLKERYNRRILFEGGQIVDPDQGEFLCPVCRRLVNSTLPALPKEFKNFGKLLKASSPSKSQSDSKTININISFPYIQQALALLENAASMVGRCEILQALPIHETRRVEQNLEPVLGLLYRMYFPGRMDMLTHPANVSHSSIMWDTLRYSLISTEIAARSGRTHMTPTYSLDSLYEELGESGGFILSLLVKIIQKSRRKDPTQVLLRFSGLQLFAASVCSGISIDNFNWSTSEKESIFRTVEYLEGDFPSPDIQLLKRAAGPILARDPFSSLMWTLFCLPCPFLICEEAFLSLVHIFYVVSVTQAIITYCTTSHCKITELNTQDCMITDIAKAMESVPQHHFICNYIDPTCGLSDKIKSLSFPYLRRCVLLSKLVSDSASAPFSYATRAMEGPSYVTDDVMNISSSNQNQLREFENLEKMFKIPTLDVILKDAMLRSLALKWVNHFCIDYKAQSLQCVLYSAPAVPFSLMHLPDLYENILQRYIKQCCPDCYAVPEEPALCLLCGRLCSPIWKPCCRVNGTNAHAKTCGAGIGVFLLIRKTTIVLHSSTRQGPWPSIYLDEFGEEDHALRRGRPLYLNKERYAALSYLVASHGLDRSSKVLQTTVGFPLLI